MTTLHPDVESVLFTEEEIAARVVEIAGSIKRDSGGIAPLLVGVLKGSFMFMSDLLRALDMDCQVDFMAVSSYGAGSVSSGQVRVVKDIGCDIEGRDVILVEDILDSGQTLSHILKMMRARNPKSLRLCVLMDKPDRRKTAVTPDYVGFSIPDVFAVGYGLDYAERYRGLPYVGILKPEVY
jgi:hypoxanthine phosphoribosyltransferase